MEQTLVPSPVHYSENSLTEQIRIALTEHLSQEEDVQLETYECLSVVERPFSTVAFLKVRTSKDERRFVAKTITHCPENKALIERENQAVVEYDILKHLYPRFQEVDHCSVPRPVLVLPEIETYVTEFVEGDVLAGELRHARRLTRRRGFRLLCEHFHSCGRWLTKFQEFTGPRVAGVEAVQGTLELCGSFLRKLESAPKHSRFRDLANRIQLFLRAQRARLVGEKIPVAGRHGDFGPWNILAGKRGITVLDFLGFEEDAILIDPLRMLVALEDEKLCVTANPRRVEELKQSFLQGYGPLPDVPEPLAAICETMQRLRSVWQNFSSKGGPPHRRVERRRCLNANVEWLENEDGRKLLWSV